MQGGHLLGNAILFFLVLLPVTRAALRNITIDDAQGDEVTGAKPIYTPPNQWYAISSQSRCDGICDPNPGIDEAYFSTWHVATGFPTEPSRIEFKFNGSAVFIYCILAGNARPNSQTHLSLLVDGVEMDTFHWIPTNNTPPFYYQVPVLSASALESRTHFVVVLSAVTAIDYSVIFFDFAVYR
ncbi:hypothetical protein BKA62DRAFT_694248 [Auriculariales sp. MPI-PUGE-AT-0066]|nr:hypothetical protein BKA62DRAFT_694248 [Auriculariales sp. MPI-PUGE-AT-0066]